MKSASDLVASMRGSLRIPDVKPSEVAAPSAKKVKSAQPESLNFDLFGSQTQELPSSGQSMNAVSDSLALLRQKIQSRSDESDAQVPLEVAHVQEAVAAPKRRGRKSNAEKAAMAAAAAQAAPAPAPAVESVVAEAPKRPRGRPAGSKNKPKAVDVALVAPSKGGRPKGALSSGRRDNVAVVGDDYHYVVGARSLKHPAIFPQSKTKGLDKPRTVILEKATESSPFEYSVVLMGNSEVSSYTTDTLEVMAILNSMWQEQGGSREGRVKGTYSEVARRLRTNDSQTRKKVKQEVDRLRRLHLAFTRSRYANGKVVETDVEDITYLDGYRYNAQENASLNHFDARINPHIMKMISEGEIASLPIKALLAMNMSESKSLILRIDSLLHYKERAIFSDGALREMLFWEKGNWRLASKGVLAREIGRIAEDLNDRVLTCGHMLIAEMSMQGEAPYLLCSRGAMYVPRITSTAKIKYINADSELIADLTDEMMDAVGLQKGDESRGLYESYARKCSEDVVRLAISTFKADKPKDLRSAGAFFNSVITRIAGERGFYWA